MENFVRVEVIQPHWPKKIKVSIAPDNDLATDLIVVKERLNQATHVVNKTNPFTKKMFSAQFDTLFNLLLDGQLVTAGEIDIKYFKDNTLELDNWEVLK